MRINTVHVFGLEETSVNWYQVLEEHWLRERVSEWWEGKHVVIGYDVNDDMQELHQWGGVALMTTNQITN